MAPPETDGEGRLDAAGARTPLPGAHDPLGATEQAHDGCQIGSYPFFRDGRVGANFVIRSTDLARLDACAADLLARLQAAGLPVVPEEI